MNLRNTLAPSSGQGIWVDDRSVMSGTGNSKSYSFNVTQTGPFKTVLLGLTSEVSQLRGWSTTLTSR